MGNEAHQKDGLGVAANLHVGKDARRPAVRELAVGKSLVAQAQTIRALPFGLLNRCAHIGGRAGKTPGIHAGFLQHPLQALVDRGLVRLPRAGLSQRHNHAAGAVGVAVVLHIQIAHHAAGFRMDGVQVIAFVKRFYADFPVRAPFASHMAHHPHLVDLVVLEVALGQANSLLERGWVIGHADEDQPRVLFAGYWCESGAVTDHGVLKGFLIGDGAQLPVVAKTPTVEGTDKDFFVATLLGE